MDKVILGIDEVGRGCWAGPLVAGAVILASRPKGLTDSKLLSRKKRETLAEQIYAEATFCQLGWVWPEEIDRLGLTNATALAIQRSIAKAPRYDILLIDGSINFQSSNPRARNMVQADLNVPAVSAASIVAKVARDEFMLLQEKNYPGYRFGSHVGYGTLAHKNALSQQGPTPLHRLSYKPVQKFAGTK